MIFFAKTLYSKEQSEPPFLIIYETALVNNNKNKVYRHLDGNVSTAQISPTQNMRPTLRLVFDKEGELETRFYFFQNKRPSPDCILRVRSTPLLASGPKNYVSNSPSTP
jgi:hypothetical protein